MDSTVTSQYDIFVNSCYGDSTVSMAKKSIYIVSFPHKFASKQFKESYLFVPNSNYTNKWIDKYWGKCKSTVVFPLVNTGFYELDRSNTKEKIIVSVGRFASSGHIKNQLEIVKGFKQAVNEKPIFGWKLVLIGSVNSADYLEQVRKESVDADIEIVTNASYERVADTYKRASIYIHASGFGRSEYDEPQLQEHFGMAVAQGVCAGCYPVVFEAAGPAEIVNKFGFGEFFKSESDLPKSIIRAIDKVSLGLGKDYWDAVEAAKGHYGKAQFKDRILKILDDA